VTKRDVYKKLRPVKIALLPFSYIKKIPQ